MTIREMHADEAAEISRMTMRAFDTYVGHELSEEGVAAYVEYADPEALLARHQSDHFTLVASLDGEIAGMIEFRKDEHLSMMFVAPEFHRRGIARRLYDAALERVVERNPDLEKVTVNSSRYAVPVYERLGFAATGDEQVRNGILFVPMASPIGWDRLDPGRAGGHAEAARRRAADEESA